DEAGAETGMFEIPAGGRRYRALELLVKQKRLGKTAPIPCVVREGGVPEEDSLAENIQRAPMLGSVLQLSCWVRTAVTAIGDIHGAYRGRHTDVRVKCSRSEARTTLDAAATPQAFQWGAGEACTPATWRTGEREGNPSHSEDKSAPEALRLR